MDKWKRRLRRLRHRARKSWYEQRHGIQPGSMLPALKRGKYVSVLRKGSYIDLIPEQPDYFSDGFTFPLGSFIRLIPYQGNHGLMVEYWSSPVTMRWRTHCDIGAFRKMGFEDSEKSGG